MSLLASLNVTTTLAHLLSSLFVSSILKLPAEAYRRQGVQRLKPTLLSLSLRPTLSSATQGFFYFLTYLIQTILTSLSLSLTVHPLSLLLTIYFLSLSNVHLSLSFFFFLLLSQMPTTFLFISVCQLSKGTRKRNSINLIIPSQTNAIQII